MAIDNVVWDPAILADTPVGSGLAAMLEDIDIRQCSGHDRVLVLQAHQRMRSHYAAQSYHAMTAVVDAIDPEDMAEDFVEQAGAAEIAAALRLTRHAAGLEVRLAMELQWRLPSVWAALCDGVIDVRTARAFVDGTLHLSIATAREVVAQVADDAKRLTTGQLRAKLRKLCIQADPLAAKERYQHAVTQRRMVVEPTLDGVAEVHLLDVPPDRAHAMARRINNIALGMKRAGETRTMDQLRADVALDLLEGAKYASAGGVHLTVDLGTLATLTDHPGELAGYGPVIADIARQVAHNQTSTNWPWSLIDRDTGLPIDGGITRRRPTTAQQRKTRALNPTCIHPGCRMPAIDCDIDHRIPWAETRTTVTDNLAPLCRHHHRLKHEAGWSYEARSDGDHRFTSPLGHTYTTSGRDP